MAEYLYDPSKYLNDYSWIGKIGESISKFAYQVPEIVQLNKTVKENKKAKDVLYSSVNRYIDKLDKNIVSNIVSSMGVQLDVNDPNYERSAREALKKNIPTFSEVTKNEDYAKQIVDYFVPVIRAAQSDAGGGPLKFSDLMAGIDNNQIVEGINQTTFGKQQLEEERYQQGREREQSEYDTGFARKYGAGGELETAGSISNATDMNRTKQTSEFNREQSQGDADAAQEILSMYDTNNIDSIYRDSRFNGFSAESKKMAYEIAKNKSDTDYKKQRDAELLQYKKDLENKENLPKIYDQTQLQDKLMKVRKDMADWANKMKSFKKEQKGDPEYTLLEQAIESGKLIEREYMGALKYVGKNPKATQEQVNAAMNTARENINPEDEQKFISDWKANVYGTKGLAALNPWAIGQKDDLERFKKTYRQRFGVDPKVNETKDAKGRIVYDIVPQQGTVKDVINTTNAMTSQSYGGQPTEIANQLAALKALLEERKKQGK